MSDRFNGSGLPDSSVVDTPLFKIIAAAGARARLERAFKAKLSDADIAALASHVENLGALNKLHNTVIADLHKVIASIHQTNENNDGAQNRQDEQDDEQAGKSKKATDDIITPAEKASMSPLELAVLRTMRTGETPAQKSNEPHRTRKAQAEARVDDFRSKFQFLPTAHPDVTAARRLSAERREAEAAKARSDDTKLEPAAKIMLVD
jgi:hypothetical protein